MPSEERSELLAPTAECSATPSAPTNVSTRQNVQLRGTHTYKIVNPGGAAINVTIEAILEDSRSHSNSNSQPLTVGPHSSEQGTMNTFLTTSYDTPGNVMVTARTRITGDAFCSTSSGQNMHVT